jgi:hypothetical protein
MKLSHPVISIKLISLTALFWLQQANAIDLIPGELIAPRAGTNQFLVSYQLSERGDYYKDGRKLISGSKIEAEQIQIRLGSAFDIYGLPSFIYAQLPVGSIEPSGTLRNRTGSSGNGDASFLLALWPYSNRDTGEYLAVGGYLTLPTGSYEARNTFLNMGANRTTTALQIGYQRSLTKNLEWMTAVDGVWFGKNDDYSAAHVPFTQKNLLTSQTGLRFLIDERYSLAASYFYTQGGETSVNGKENNDPISLKRWQITGGVNLDSGRVTVQYGRDLETRNGYLETSRLIVRYGARF